MGMWLDVTVLSLLSFQARCCYKIFSFPVLLYLGFYLFLLRQTLG